MNNIEILWESKEKNQNGDPFFKVKRSRGYYIFGERVGVDSIAFILFDNNKKQFGLILESKPPLDTETELIRKTTAFGGSIDMTENHTYKDICQVEVAEETGYEVPLDKIHSIGKTLVSTQMSQMCEGFLVDTTDIEKTLEAEYEKDASEAQNEKDANEFVGNKIMWMDADGLMDNNDWKSIWIFTKAIFADIITKDYK